MNNSTPKFFTRLFKWFCQDDLYEELQGDLEEKFYQNVDELGPGKAQRIYRKEVLLMIRPSVVRKPRLINSLSQLSLFRIHFVLTFRNLARNKVFSAVNILGLAAALSVCLFLVNILYTSYNFDRQHAELSRLYRVTTNIDKAGNRSYHYAGTAMELKDQLVAEIPQVEIATSLDRTLAARFQIDNKTSTCYGYWVDEGFLKLFQFEVVEGDPTAVFEDGGGIVITSSFARRAFGSESALGQLTTKGHEVVAVIESPKGKSHMSFDVLGRKKPGESQAQVAKATKDWRDFTMSYTYLRLAKNTNEEQVNSLLAQLSDRINEENKGDTEIQYSLQKVTDIMYGKWHQGDHDYVFNSSLLQSFLILMAIVIAMASFNYTNLSMARALQRSKEIGIRKITGSTRGQIIGQFLVETIVFSLLALLLGIGIYLYFAPAFPVVLKELSALFSPELNLEIIALFILFSIAVGILAGLLPAFHFARIGPMSAISNKVKTRVGSMMRFRKILTGLQLTVSTFAVVFISVAYDQYDQLLVADLGFNYDSLVTFTADEVDPQVTINEVQRMPEVVSIAASSFIPGRSGDIMSKISRPGMADTVMVRRGLCGAGFQDLYQFKLLIGSHFDESKQLISTPQALVNQGLLKKMKLPLDSALGTVLTYTNASDSVRTVEIIGVLDGYITNAFINNNFPVIIERSNDLSKMRHFTLKMTAGKTQAGLNRIQTTLLQSNEETEFEPHFVDDEIEDTYLFVKHALKVVGFMGLVVVAISILGQLGMALYNAQTRIKEIGIRKVLGAGVFTIVNRLLKGTLISLIIAALLAAPLAYLLAQNFIPVSILKVQVNPVAMLSGIWKFSVLVCGVVILQTWRIAHQNPAESLRYE